MIPSAPTSTKRILVCDDDQDITDMVATLLKFEGYHVSVACGYTQFMETIEKVKPDLIVLDIRMPEKDGFFIAESLRVLGISTPIVFMTAHNNVAYRLYAPLVGGIEYITKPIDPEMFVDKIRKAVARI
jgi:DNA-binding response OmpR family regulator